METEIKTKKCSKCKRELPLDKFSKNNSKKDGLQCQCRDCMSVKTKKMKKVFTNTELVKFTPRQLMDELKARGYEGELKFTQTIRL